MCDCKDQTIPPFHSVGYHDENKSKASRATERPWIICEQKDRKFRIQCRKTADVLAWDIESEEDVKLIVKAVNLHEELIETLEAAKHKLMPQVKVMPQNDMYYFILEIDDLLLKAKEGN